MRTTLLVMTLIATSLTASNNNLYNNLEQRLSNLEIANQLLYEDLNLAQLAIVELRSRCDLLEGKVQPATLTIDYIDSFFRKIHLSNGSIFSYSFQRGNSIDHWLSGQPVRLERGSDSPVKLVNLETGEFISVKKE